MVTATEKANKKRVLYDRSAKALERLLAHFSAGDDRDDHGNPVTIERIASELVGRYRARGCCLGDNGVSYDGPIAADICAAMEAALERGSNAKTSE